MFGVSGSGKTWLAEGLAPLLDAVHLRSDVERKRRAGLDEHARTGSAPGQGLYAPEVSDQLYEHLARCAEDILAGSYTAIVDATFHRRADRLRFSEWAKRHGVQLTLIHCFAPPPVLEQRIAEREGPGRDASEANSSVLRWQEAHLEPLGPEDGFEIISADTTRPQVVSEVLAQFGGG
jgi:predicted kinase